MSPRGEIVGLSCPPELLIGAPTLIGLDQPVSVRMRYQRSLSHFQFGFGSGLRQRSLLARREPKYIVRPSSVKQGRSSAESCSGSAAGTATSGGFPRRLSPLPGSKAICA